MTQRPPLRVYNVVVLSHHDVLREGVAALLEAESDLDVVARAASVEDLLDLLEATSDAVVVIGHAPPDLDGIALCRSLAESRPDVRAVLLVEEPTPKTFDEAFHAGARACLASAASADQLVAAVRSAADASLGSRLESSVAKVPGFSRAQSTVLRLLVEGKTVAQIAEVMGLSPHTVRSYLRLIYRRLGVGTRGEAAAVALRRGLI